MLTWNLEPIEARDSELESLRERVLELEAERDAATRAHQELLDQYLDVVDGLEAIRKAVAARADVEVPELVETMRRLVERVGYYERGHYRRAAGVADDQLEAVRGVLVTAEVWTTSEAGAPGEFLARLREVVRQWIKAGRPLGDDRG